MTEPTDLRNLGQSCRDETFELGSRGRWINDWQPHIPPELRAVWRELSDEARGAAILVAQRAADNEEWD